MHPFRFLSLPVSSVSLFCLIHNIHFLLAWVVHNTQIFFVRMCLQDRDEEFILIYMILFEKQASPIFMASPIRGNWYGSKIAFLSNSYSLCAKGSTYFPLLAESENLIVVNCDWRAEEHIVLNKSPKKNLLIRKISFDEHFFFYHSPRIIVNQPDTRSAHIWAPPS